MKHRILLLAVAATMTLPSLVQATPVAGTCAAATTMTSFTGYLACQGAFGGNINGSASELTALNAFGGAWAGTWVWNGKSDDASNGPFSGPPGLTTIGFDGSISGKFVIGIKQSSYYSYYLFNVSPSISSINWSSLDTAPNNPGVSHIGLYTLTGGAIVSTVPEPSTYALMAAGLAALGLVARRRRKV